MMHHKVPIHSHGSSKLRGIQQREQYRSHSSANIKFKLAALPNASNDPNV